MLAAMGAAILSLSAGASLAAPSGKSECGKVSWYGPGFNGRPTASGETFNQNALTAAHKSLPFGTRLHLTDQATGKSVTVTVNDRGPFVRGRILDVSKAAAVKLGFKNRGVSKICLSYS